MVSGDMKRPTHLFSVALALAAGLAFGSHWCPAQSYTTTVLRKLGDSSPPPSATYTQILDNGPTLNNSGRVNFGVRLSTNNQAAIIGTGFIPDAILFRQESAAPDGNGTFVSFSQFGCNKAGASAFVGTLSGASPSDALKGAFVSLDSMVQVIRGGQSIPGGPGTISAISAGTPVGGIATNSLGEIAGRVQLQGTGSSTNDVAIYRGNGGPLTEVVRKGQSPPGATTIVELEAPSMNDLSEVAFLARFTGGTTYAYYVHDGTGLVEMARSGDALTGGGQIADFDTTESPVNIEGNIAFAARLVGTTNDRVLVHATDSNLTVIARKGTSAPGGGIFFDFSTTPVALNDSDELAFQARVENPAGTGTLLDTLFTWDGDTLHRIAAKGVVAPGGSDQFSGFGNPAINADGDVVFFASLFGTSDTGLFIYNASTGTLGQVIRTFTPFAGNELNSINFLSLPHLGSPFNGFNDSGQVAFRYRLTNGQTGIALCSPNPIPPAIITVESTEHTASEFTVTWSISNNAGVDVYRSSDLTAWGTPVSTNNIADTFTDSPRPAGTAFYALVPSGQSFP